MAAAADDAPAGVVTRSFDAGEINQILNDPSVGPLLSVPGIETFDVTAIVADPCNVVLMADGGGVLFCWHEPGFYEVHTAFLKAARGRHAIQASLAAYRYMFTQTDCVTLWTRVPATNPAAERFCQIVGATKEFDRHAVWPTADGAVDMSFWSLRYDDWVRKTPSLMVSGRRFHERLMEERARHGHQEALHVDEDCHDLHVGACAEMVYGGQLDKAVILYNRWAKFSGYGQIQLIARNPPMIDIGDALLQITGDTFKVIKCQ